MSQPNEYQIKYLISKILESPEFHDSKRYQDLLLYLVSKTSTVETLKETEIAHEMFGKDSSFDPGADALIRSYISNLRKKLEHYYLTTSDEFNYKVEIPKGQYLIRYVKADKKAPQQPEKWKSTYLFIGIIAFLIIVIVVRELTGPRNSDTSAFAENKIWKEFLAKPGKPTIVVLGDYVVLSEKAITSNRTFLRVPTINSEKELSDSIRNNPAKYKGLEITKVNFLCTGASLGITSLMHVLNGIDKISFKLSREITWDDIEKNNIIFIGNLKTLYKLDTLVARTNISYTLEPNTLSVYDKNKNVQKEFSLEWLGGTYEKNYGLIFKQRLSKDNFVLILSGFSTVGVLAAVKFSIDPEFSQTIRKFTVKDIPDSMPQFKLVIESEGLGYNVFKSQLKYFENF